MSDRFGKRSERRRHQASGNTAVRVDDQELDSEYIRKMKKLQIRDLPCCDSDRQRRFRNVAQQGFGIAAKQLEINSPGLKAWATTLDRFAVSKPQFRGNFLAGQD
jgi:hypothetical protein